MKQRMVIKVPTNCPKSCSDAFKIVVGRPGVESASLKEEDKRQIEVIGEGVDPVKLISILRKKMGHADLVSVGEVKNEEKPKEEKPKEKPTNEGHAQPIIRSEVPPFIFVCEAPPCSYDVPCCFM